MPSHSMCPLAETRSTRSRLIALLLCGIVGCHEYPGATTKPAAEQAAQPSEHAANETEMPKPEASATAAAASPAESPATNPAEPAWQDLFDGKTLKNWKKTEFGGEGEVTVEEGAIILEQGSDMTGITWDGGDLPKVDYEVSVEAQRVSGEDFFCGLTFMINDSPCSLIVGGWGGAVVGLSSIDGRDASENDTTKLMSFDKKRWYTIRLKVAADRVETWIDQEKVIDQDIKDKKISIRSEVELNKPLGFSTWSTTGALKNIKLRKLAAK